MYFFNTRRFLVLCLITGIIGLPAFAQKDQDLTLLSLEELMSLEVITVSKKPQKLLEVPASVYVMHEEYIIRTGARTIPELLRFAPGIEVASIDANKWAISARGFSDRFANKLLVLMDGRSVYISPFSGVYWDAQDFILEDIGRIEIIRGPGASIWGANAVNGVINILTKSASETQGILIGGSMGTSDREAYMRYGFPFSSRWDARSYIKTHSHESRQLNSGLRAGDAWHTIQGGIRLDGRPNDRDKWMFESDLYTGIRGRTITSIDLSDFELFTLIERGNVTSGHVLCRWQRTLSPRSEFIIQSYIDHSLRNAEELSQRYIIWDLELQHRFPVGENHDIVWGTAYHLIFDRLKGTPFTNTYQESRVQQLVSNFFQDDIQFFNKQLSLTVGSKVEYNSFTGFEIQPTIRTIWKGLAKHHIWAAVSRAVRTPSRMERDADILAAYSPAGNLTIQEDYPLFARLEGQPNFDSETLLAFEAGYRYQLNSYFSLDFSLYHNQYDKLRIARLGDTRLMGTIEKLYLEQSLMFTNDMTCQTSGFESVFELNINHACHLHLIYSYLTMHFDYDKAYEVDGQVLTDYSDKKSPSHQIGIWISWNPMHKMKIDALWHYQSPNKMIDDPLNQHTRIRMAWQLTKTWSAAIVAQNLWEANKLEFASSFPGILIHNAASTQIPRSVYINTCFQLR